MTAGTTQKPKDWFQSIVVESVVPLLLMTSAPMLSITSVHYSVVSTSGSEHVLAGGISSYLRRVISDADFSDPYCWFVVILLAVWSAVVPLSLGGKKFMGPPTVTGYRVEYVDSATRYYLLTTAITAVAVLWGPVGMPLYSRLYPFTCVSNLLGVVCTAALYVKSFLSPSPGDHGTTGNPVFDFYWGRELYPRIGRLLDIKMWAVLFYGVQGAFCVTLVCWKAQYERTGWNWAMAAASVILVLYGLRVYWGYREYTCSIDQMYDRTGFYLVWGSVGWVPTYICCGSVYMVEHPSDLGPLSCLLLVVVGATAIVLSYWTDNQRIRVREADGQCQVWGQPARVVRTCYQDGSGKTRKGLLLASGFWGLSRHPNYVLEVVTYLSLALTAKTLCLIPYLYVLILVVLMAHRLGRDDNKCRSKYGSSWDEYCSLVPYRVLPGIY